MQEVEITRFSPGDEDGIADVILPIQREEFGLAITLGDQPDLNAIKDFYQAGLGDFWVARADGRIVGTIGLRDIGGRRAALRKMFVAEAYRGRGYGVAARLLATLLSAAKARGISEIFLGTTARFLAAHRFYEKNGFAEIDPVALPESFPRMAVDTKFYRLVFD
jgi:N-acetylglutamate synthase-like GNAT family acetyltransferase